MNIFPLDISRLPELVALCFLRWKRHRRYSCLAAIIAGVTASTCAQAATVRAGNAVTVVRDVSGSVSGTSWEKKIQGDDVYESEFVRTAVRSSAILSFVDETKISIGQAATMKIDRVVLRSNQSIEELIVSAEAGAMRWNSGTSPSRAYQIRTPDAIIRPVGTMFDLLVESQRTMAVLRRGTIEVCSVGAPQRCEILSRPGEMIIATPGNLEGPQRGELGPSEFASRCLSADAIPCLITASISPAEPAQRQFGKGGSKGTGPSITGPGQVPSEPTSPPGPTGVDIGTGPTIGPIIIGPIGTSGDKDTGSSTRRNGCPDSRQALRSSSRSRYPNCPGTKAGDGGGGKKTDSSIYYNRQGGKLVDKGTIKGSKAPGGKVLIDKGSISAPLGTGRRGGPSGIRGPVGIGGQGPSGIGGLFGIGGHRGGPSGMRGPLGIGGRGGPSGIRRPFGPG